MNAKAVFRRREARPGSPFRDGPAINVFEVAREKDVTAAPRDTLLRRSSKSGERRHGPTVSPVAGRFALRHPRLRRLERRESYGAGGTQHNVGQGHLGGTVPAIIAHGVDSVTFLWGIAAQPLEGGVANTSNADFTFQISGWGE